MTINIVDLSDRIVSRNANFLADAVIEGADRPLSGIVYHGYNSASANILPRSGGAVDVRFELTVASITSATFEEFRGQVRSILGVLAAEKIESAAGIRSPPPLPASRMARYVVELFCMLFGKDDTFYLNRNRPFSRRECRDGLCNRVLEAIRGLQVGQLSFHGTLSLSHTQSSPISEKAYVPVCAIEFSDKLTIPFSGYSNNVKLTTDENDPEVTVPNLFWRDL